VSQQKPGLLGKQHLVGPDLKAWLANGLEEVRSVFTPNTQGVQLGNTPGTMFTPTTGEQTAERLGESHETGRMSLSDIMAAGQDVETAREQQRTQQKGLER
jgi:hypothetical protein